ncbi:GNAT family N-acetyltransferase [Paenibacillus sp. MBLB4367]|uniref:GNAT family N-acetyltransferase n=1 Tax=Paenibacillus sp. MBLB4367 TaxID=3384767 RepID=UPI0039082187
MAVKLVEPAIDYKEEYLDMLAEWQAAGEKLVPFVLRMDASDFAGMVHELHGYRNGRNVPDTFVEHSTYWLVDDDAGKMLGAVNIRHRLNERLLHIGGHIGYGIRPSERRKGLATELLRLALEQAARMGLERVLLTCNKSNVGSAKTIVNNGGVLDSEDTDDQGVPIQRYWIDGIAADFTD